MSNIQRKIFIPLRYSYMKLEYASRRLEMSKIKAVVVNDEELDELNKKAERMHLSTSRLMVLGGLNWDGHINDRKE